MKEAHCILSFLIFAERSKTWDILQPICLKVQYVVCSETLFCSP